MTDIESAEFYAARLVVRLHDIDGDPELESQIATELRERDAAIRRAALQDVREILAMHKYIGYERTDESTLSDDPEMVEARLIEGLVQDLERAVAAIDRKDPDECGNCGAPTESHPGRRNCGSALADSDAEGKP